MKNDRATGYAQSQRERREAMTRRQEMNQQMEKDVEEWLSSLDKTLEWQELSDNLREEKEVSCTFNLQSDSEQEECSSLSQLSSVHVRKSSGSTLSPTSSPAAAGTQSSPIAQRTSQGYLVHTLSDCSPPTRERGLISRWQQAQYWGGSDLGMSPETTQNVSSSSIKEWSDSTRQQSSLDSMRRLSSCLKDLRDVANQACFGPGLSQRAIEELRSIKDEVGWLLSDETRSGATQTESGTMGTILLPTRWSCSMKCPEGQCPCADYSGSPTGPPSLSSLREDLSSGDQRSHSSRQMTTTRPGTKKGSLPTLSTTGHSREGFTLMFGGALQGIRYWSSTMSSRERASRRMSLTPSRKRKNRQESPSPVTECTKSRKKSNKQDSSSS